MTVGRNFKRILFFIAVSNLAPGTAYIMEVSAYKKSFTGQPASITVVTDGKPLPNISGLVAEIPKTLGTTVKLRWNAPKNDSYKEGWEYGIYYALNTTDLLLSMLLVEKLLKSDPSKNHQL
jgi:hypothetical protein